MKAIHPRIERGLYDIRYWLYFFFLIRLVGISNAPLETSHNWRQSLTNMIARNFYENGLDFLHPMIDMAGEKTGIIGSEFPFFNALIYLMASIFGYEHWYGRLINLVVSSFGAYAFYLMVKRLLQKRIAFLATLILSCSIWFGYARKIMPDTFSVSLVLIGLYFLFRFVERSKSWHLLLFFVFSTLGVLCKIPALCLFSGLALLPFLPQVKLKQKIQILATAALSFALVCTWYFYWVPHLVKTYGYQLFFPHGFIEGALEIIPLWDKFLEKFYFSALFSYVGFGLFLLGVYFLFRSKAQWIKAGILLIALVFFLFILKTGSVFPLHSYYITPFVPIMAVLAAYGLAKIPKPYQYILLLGIIIEGISNQQHQFFIKADKKYKLALEENLRPYVPRSAKIIINGGDSPQSIYFANRKGWTIKEEQLNPPIIDSLRQLGAAYLIIDQQRSSFQARYEKLFQDEHYSIYRLDKK